MRDTYSFRDGKVPDWELLKKLGEELSVNFVTTYDQGARLREMLEQDRPDVVCSIRRHWHDLSLRRPTQNWHMDPDWQARIVRNSPDIYFDSGTKMHERLVGAQTKSYADMVTITSGSSAWSRTNVEET